VGFSQLSFQNIERIKQLCNSAFGVPDNCAFMEVKEIFLVQNPNNIRDGNTSQENSERG